MGDATFLSSLVSLYKSRAELDGLVVLVLSDATFDRILRIVRFDKLFPVVPNIQEAYRLIASRLTPS